MRVDDDKRVCQPQASTAYKRTIKPCGLAYRHGQHLFIAGARP